MSMKRNFLICGITLVCVSLGIIIGNNVAQWYAKKKIEHVNVPNIAVARTEPSILAPQAALEKGNNMLIVGKVDFSKLNKKGPTVVRVDNSMTLEKADTHKKYEIKGGTYYKVVEYKGEKVVIAATTDTKDLVNLEVPKNNTTAYDEGKWLQVQDKQGNTGWVN